MDTEPLAKVFPLNEGNESITQRRDWIKINIAGPVDPSTGRGGSVPLRTPLHNLSRRPITIWIHD